MGRQNICDQKQSPGFSVGELPLSPQKHPGVQPLPDLQKQACTAGVRGIFLTVHGDEPTGYWYVQGKAAPACYPQILPHVAGGINTVLRVGECGQRAAQRHLH